MHQFGPGSLRIMQKTKELPEEADGEIDNCHKAQQTIMPFVIFFQGGWGLPLEGNSPILSTINIRISYTKKSLPGPRPGSCSLKCGGWGNGLHLLRSEEQEQKGTLHTHRGSFFIDLFY